MNGSTVGKYNLCTPQDKSIGSADKGKGRHYDFITRFDVDKDCGHLKGMCAAGGKQYIPEPEFSLKKVVAQSGKLAVSRNLSGFYGFPDVFCFFTRQVGLVVGDLQGNYEL
jgi:hypothetical protein